MNHRFLRELGDAARQRDIAWCTRERRNPFVAVTIEILRDRGCVDHYARYRRVDNVSVLK